MFYLIYEDILRAWYRIKDYEPQLKAFFLRLFYLSLNPKILLRNHLDMTENMDQ